MVGGLTVKSLIQTSIGHELIDQHAVALVAAEAKQIHQLAVLETTEERHLAGGHGWGRGW